MLLEKEEKLPDLSLSDFFQRSHEKTLKKTRIHQNKLRYVDGDFELFEVEVT